MKTQNCKSTVGARLGSCTYEITYLGTFLEGLFEIDITAFADQSHSAVEARNLMLEIFVADHVVMDLIVSRPEWSPIPITKKPDLNDPVLRAKLAKGMGHNYYGELAWPNDLLYIFPVVILGTIACNVGLAVLKPSMIGEPADPFATPLEILPEWYFFPVFQILHTVPNKLLGVLLMDP